MRAIRAKRLSQNSRWLSDLIDQHRNRLSARRQRFSLTVFIRLVALASLLAAAQTQAVVDQSNQGTAGAFVFITSDRQFGQTFEVGISGRLNSIAIGIQAPIPAGGTLIGELRNVDANDFPVGGPILAQPLGTVVDGLNVFDFSVFNYPVTAGQRYALVLRKGEPGSQFNVSVTTPDQYLAGQATLQTSPGASWIAPSNGTADAIFQTDVIPANTINGRITGEGDPLSAVTVCFFRALDTGFAGCSETNSNGDYSSPPLSVEPHFVRVEGIATAATTGFIGQIYNGETRLGPGNEFDRATPVGVTPLGTAGIDFDLAPGHIVSGSITDPLSTTGIDDSGVCLYGESGEFVVCWGADPSGNYQTTPVPAGNYFIESYTPGQWIDEWFGSDVPVIGTTDFVTEADLVAVPGPVSGNVDFALIQGATISGNVVRADAPGGAVENVTVCFTTSNGGGAGNCMSTDASGDYESNALPPGDYVVEAIPEDGSGLTGEYYNDKPRFGVPDPFGGADRINVATSDVTGIDFALSTGFVISGFITDAVTGAAVANGGVCVNRADTRDFVLCTGVDGTGFYRSAGLPAGSYVIEAYPTDDYVGEFHDDVVSIAPGDPFASATPVAVGPGDATINFALNPGGRISGRVFDASTDAGLSGAVVCVDLSAGGGAGCFTTDTGGNYQTQALPPGDYTVNVQSFSVPGYLGEFFDNVLEFSSDAFANATRVSVGTTTVTGIDLGLSSGFTISGNVAESATGVPFDDVTVCFTDTVRQYGTCTQTDSSGNFTSLDLPPGEYVVEVSSFYVPGFIGEYYDDQQIASSGVSFETADRVTIVDQDVIGIFFGLDRGASISGTVTVDGTTTPVEAVNVCFYRSLDRSFVSCADTDAAGVYTSDALPEGSYIVQTFNTGNLVREFYDDVSTLGGGDPFSLATPVVVGSNNVTGIDFGLAGGFSLSGTVTDAASLLPLPGVTVCVRSIDGYSECPTTEADGTYTAIGLPAGEYVIEIDGFSLGPFIPEYFNDVSIFVPGSFDLATRVTLGPDNASGVDFALASANTISGNVTNELTGDGVGATVCFNDSVTFAGVCTAADQNGDYTSPGLAPGSYRVAVYPPSGLLREYFDNIPLVGPADPESLATLVSVTAGSQTGIDFALSTGNSISGRVLADDTGDPVINANVCAYTAIVGQFGNCANTNFNGDYTIEGLADADWVVEVPDYTAPGFVGEYFDDVSRFDSVDAFAEATPVTVSGAPVIGIDFSLATGYTISGSLLEEGTLSPLPGSSVCVYRDDGTFVSCPFVDAAGNFTTEFLPNGEYVLQASAIGVFSEYYDDVSQFSGDRFDDADRITISGGDVSGIDFQLSAGNVISGLVTSEADGSPIANAQICAFDSADSQVGCYNSDAAGAYTSNLLPQDEYRLEVRRADGFIREFYDDLSIEEFGLSSATPVTVGPDDATGIDFALSQATVIELSWEARVTGTSAIPPDPGFGVEIGDVIRGRIVYDSAAVGAPASSGTQYSGAVVLAEAELNGQLLVSGSDGNFIRLDDQPAGFSDGVFVEGGENIGSFGGVGIIASINLAFTSVEDALDGEELGVTAPSLSDFETATVSIAGYPTGSLVGLGADILSVQAKPLRNADRDGDGLANVIENELGLNPDDPSDANVDLDADGIGTLAEIRGSSDPQDTNAVPQAGFLRFHSGSIVVDEGKAFIPVDVVRFAGNAGEVSVRVVTEDGTAIKNTHYTDPVNPDDSVARWLDGESGARRVEIPIIDTPGFDISRSLRLRLVDAVGAEIAVDSGLAFIASNSYDDQGLPFAGFIDVVQFDVRAEEDSGELELLLNRRASADGRVAIDYAIDVFSGAAPTVPSLTGSVVWEDGDAGLKSILIPLYDNAAIGPELDFSLRLSNPGGDSLPGTNGGVTTIEDEEALLRQIDTVGFAARGRRILETDGSVSIPLLRTGTDTSQPLSVGVILLDLGVNPVYALPGSDFDGAAFPQTVTWGASDTAVKYVTFDVFDDSETEELEIFVPLVSGNTSNREVISIARIFDGADANLALDSDRDGVPDIGDLDNDNDGVADAIDAFPFDASESADDDLDGLGNNIDTDIDGDGVGDSIESILGLDPTDPDDAAVEDFDDDGFSDAREVAAGSDPLVGGSVPGSGYIEFSTRNVELAEGSGSVAIELHRIRGDVGELTVRVFSEDVNAVAGVHYNPVDQEITWGDQDVSTRQVFVSAFDNFEASGNLTFKVRLEAAGTTSPNQIAAAETLVLITEDDYQAGTAAFDGFIGVNGVTRRVRESAGSITVQVNRRASTQGRFTVDYELAPDTAVEGTDYIARSGTLSWEDGESQAQFITIPLVDNLEVDGTRYFSLELLSAYDDEAVVIEIVDDEVIRLPNVVSATSSESNIDETENPGTLYLARFGDGLGPITVDVVFFDAGATDPEDYDAASPQQVSWASGETGVKPVSFGVTDDSAYEQYENFLIGLPGTSGVDFDGGFFDASIVGPVFTTYIVDEEDINLIADGDTDGIVDFVDLDDDNDGFNDLRDEFPNDPTRAGDFDGDGVDDLIDEFPNNRNVSSDDLLTVDPNASQKLFGLAPGSGVVETDESDRFGVSLDVFGDRLAVGARQAGDDGAVYTFDRVPNTITPDPNDTVWQQSGKATAEDPSISYFGSSVSLSGDLLLTGAWIDNDQGSAYLFGFDPSDGWIQQAKLLSGNVQTDEFFGIGVALDGDTALVGASGSDALGTDSGAAYIYSPDEFGDWVLISELNASDGAADHSFGLDLAVQDNVAVVGAAGADGLEAGSGAVYVFLRDDAGNWNEQAKLTAPDGETGDGFGVSVALDGSWLVVGAQNDDGTGSAYFFSGRDGNFVFRQKIDNPDASPGASFGRGLDISGNLAVVGAPFGDPSQAYAYAYDGTTWSLQQTLQSDDPGNLSSWFGFAVGVGADLIIGDREDDDEGFSAGAAYAFGLSLVNSDGDALADIFDPDDDNDGVQDRVENAYSFMNRLDPDDAGLDVSDPNPPDEDGDGISNGRELLAGFRPDSDDSVAGAGYVSLESTLISREETAGFLPVEVRRVRGDVGTVSVRVETFDGATVPGDPDTPTAQAGVDYAFTSEVVTWLDGERDTRTVNVPLLTTAERRSGVFGIRVLPEGNAQVLADEARALILESNLDDTGIDFGGFITNGSFGTLVADSAGEVAVELIRHGSAEGAVSVDYEWVAGAGGSPIAGEDFVATSGTVTWLDGDRAPKQITLSVLDDPFVAVSQEVTLQLSNVSPTASLTSFRQSVNIVHDEWVQLDAISSTAQLTYHEETDPVIRARFVRLGRGVGEVELETAFEPLVGTATLNEDFDATPITVTWPAGVLGVQEVTVPLTDDDFLDQPGAFESIFFNFVSITPGTFLADYFLPVPIVFDFEDRDFDSDNDGDGTPDLWDLDNDNDLIPNFDDATPFGMPFVNPIADVTTTEDNDDTVINLLAALDPGPVVDQQEFDGTGQQEQIHAAPVRTVGQTVTVGVAGRLQSLELPLAATPGVTQPLTIRILDLSTGTPATAAALGSVDVPVGALGAYPETLDPDLETATVVDLSALGIVVAAGDEIAIELSSSQPFDPGLDFYTTRVNTGNGYERGYFYQEPTAAPGSLDLAFKLSIDPTIDTPTFAIAANDNPALFNSVGITGNNLVLSLALNASGEAQITVRAETADGISADTFQVVVDPIADAPNLLVADPPPGIINVPIALNPGIIEASLNDTDGSEELLISIEQVPVEYVLSAGTLVSPGIWSLTQLELVNLSLQPVTPFDGTFALGVSAIARETATGFSSSISGVINVTVLDVNQIPDAVVDDAGIVQVGSTTVIDVLANDTGIADTPLTVTISAEPIFGAATANADGTITYTAPDDIAGDIEFAYTVTDNDGEADSADVTLFVNSTPVAVADLIESVINESATFNVLDNDEGLLNPPITVAITTPPATGSLVVNGDNTLTYTPTTDFAGSETAEYQITDGDGETASAVVDLFSDAFPLADPDDGGDTVIGTPILGINVLQNDLLGNGPTTLTVELTPNSTVAVNDDDPLNPILDYLPNSGFSGADTFFYRITDDDGDFSIGQVSVQVSSASGIPGQNFNVVGPTPDDPLYVPDTGLRQQNEVQCAYQSDNLLRVMCAYNDWRNVEANEDGHIGISQTRDGNTWFSRLAPHHNLYEETLGFDESSDLDPDLGFSADPVIASVPGGMLTGFIASFRDEDLRGTGGLYMQRWYEQNSEIGFPFEPQRELIEVAAGEPGRFIDKDHMIYTINQTSAADLVPVGGTRERPTMEETDFDRLWPAGEVTFIYSEFNGSDGEIVNFEGDEYPNGAPLTNPDWTVTGDGSAVTIESPPLLTSNSLTIDHAENAGDLPNIATLNDILPNAATRGARILFDVFLTAPDTTTAGTYRFVTPYGVISYGNGVVGVLGQPDQPIETAGKFLQIEMFADPSPDDTTAARFSVKVTDIAETDPALAIVAQFDDVPIAAVAASSAISISSDVPATAETALGTRLYIEALGVQVATDSDIVVKQSADFGDSWGNEYKLTPPNEGTAAHQGAYLAEFGGTMLAVWRRIDDPLNTDPDQSDAIMFAFADEGGADWTGIVGQPMAWQTSTGLDSEICPFDQFTGKDRFRTLTFPVAVGTSDGFLVFWADRKYAGGSCDAGAARIVMSRYLGGGLWSTPTPIDPIPAEDPGSLGHQFMPAAAVAQGQVQVAWYDSRNDESRSFTNEIFDATSTNEDDQRLYVRHTLDVRSVRLVGAVPVGPSIQVTQFKQGVLTDDSGATSELVQLERFYANGRIFRQGDSPFLGDYIGVATKDHRFLADEGRWISNKTFDSSAPEEPQFLVSWADNRDVLGDVWENLNDPTEYQPSEVVDSLIAAARARKDLEADADESPDATSPDAPTPLLADAAESESPATADSASTAAIAADALPDSADADGTCVVGEDDPFAGQTRNQNIYAAVIRPGFQLSVPTPSKSLGGFQRGFVLYLQNFTSAPRNYQISIEEQPDGGRASFRQVEADSEAPQTLLDVFIPPRSSTARTVYITAGSGDPSADQTVPVLVQETGACEQPETDDCQRQEILLNASPLANDFSNESPEGDLVGGVSTNEKEVSVPLVAAPIVTPGLQFPGLQFPGLQFPGLQFPGLQFPGLQFPGLQFPGLQFNPDNPGLQFPGLQFPGLQFPGLQFPGLQFPGLQFDPESDAPRPVDFSQSGTVVAAPGGTQDATQNAELAGVIEGLEMTEILWPVSNGGNVLNSFNLEPFVAADITDSPSQLLVVRTSVTNTIINCELQPKIEQDVIVNIANPDLDGEDSGVQVFIAPGETLLVILRVWQQPMAEGEEAPLFSMADETNTSIAVIATSCDSDTAGETCDPEDPTLRPPTADDGGAHPINASFDTPPSGTFDVNVARLRRDIATGNLYHDITITNISADPQIGQLRLLLGALNKQPLNAIVEEVGATPYLPVLPDNNSVIQPGEAVTVRVFFGPGRPRPSFTPELSFKSVMM